MEPKTRETGMAYEKLLMRAYQLKTPLATVGADRRIYYLLYYIRIGWDLRQTGYPAQFNQIKENITTALEWLLQQELHKEEKLELKRLLNDLNEVWSEPALELLLKKALRFTARLSRQTEETVA